MSFLKFEPSIQAQAKGAPADRDRQRDNAAAAAAAAMAAADKSAEESKMEAFAQRAHLLQVESDVRRLFDGLGSPVSNDADRALAHSLKASLMFGEILFNGVSRIMDSAHLHAAKSGTRTLYDLGSGCGRLCVQVFLQFPNLERVVGVELTSVRSKVGFEALTRMGKTPPKGYESRSRVTFTDRPHLTYTFATTAPASTSTAVVSSSQQQQQPVRTLELHQGNLFDFGPNQAWTTDLLICETNIDVSMQYDFLHFLAHCKNGCRLLTYNSLENMYEDVCARLGTTAATGTAGERKSNDKLVKPPFPWKRMDINTYEDKFSASWGEIRFHLYTCIAPPEHPATAARARERADSNASSTASPAHASSSASASAASTPRSHSHSHSHSHSSSYRHQPEQDDSEGYVSE